MSFSKYSSIGAIGFCMSVLPLMTHAQSAEASSDDTALFVPMVNECVEMPNAETCGKVRAVVTECAEEFERALCDVLFTEPDEVFDSLEMRERAQESLAETSEVIAETTFEDVDEAEIEGIIEESRADAERTMLRGAANPMSHSGPPSVEEN